MNGILFAFLGTIVTFLVTTLGAAGVFCVKRDVNEIWQSGFLGFCRRRNDRGVGLVFAASGN